MAEIEEFFNDFEDGEYDLKFFREDIIIKRRSVVTHRTIYQTIGGNFPIKGFIISKFVSKN